MYLEDLLHKGTTQRIEGFPPTNARCLFISSIGITQKQHKCI